MCNACKGSVFCGACSTWKTKAAFRSGADSCKTCQRITCAGCGEEKQRTEYTAMDVHNYFSHNQNVVCHSCRHAGLTPQEGSHKCHKKAATLRTCSTCGVPQELRAFRRSKEQRIDVCRTCELIPCEACALRLPQQNFDLKDIDNHFSLAQKVVCQGCKARGSSVVCDNLDSTSAPDHAQNILAATHTPPLTWPPTKRTARTPWSVGAAKSKPTPGNKGCSSS